MSGRVIAAADLEGALGQLGGGEVRRGFETLLAAWRELKAPELATLLEAVSRNASPRFAAIGKTKREEFISLVEHLKTADVLELSASCDLVLAVARQQSQAAKLALCLDGLVLAKNDPRLTLPAIAMLELPGGASSWGKIPRRLVLATRQARDDLAGHSGRRVHPTSEAASRRPDRARASDPRRGGIAPVIVPDQSPNLDDAKTVSRSWSTSRIIRCAASPGSDASATLISLRFLS